MQINRVVLSAAGLLLLSPELIPTMNQEVAGLFSSKSEKPKCETARSVLHEIGEQNIRGEWQGKNVAYQSRAAWKTSADFLFWRADEDGLEYSQSYQTNGSGREKYETHKPRISWDPGVRVGVGYLFGSDDHWDLFGQWTYFYTAQNNNGAHDTTIPWWYSSLTGSTAQQASVRWTLHYNTFDVELGRHYFLSRRITLRPLVGVRGAIINQQYNASYQGVFSPSEIASTSVQNTIDFWGAGVRAAGQIFWHMTKQWSVTASFGGSLLYGHFDVDQTIQGSAALRTEDNDISRLSPNLEASLGFQWEHFFSNDKYRLSIGAKYEFNEWFGQNQAVRGDSYQTASFSTPLKRSDRVPGDLGLQGGTLRVEFDF